MKTLPKTLLGPIGKGGDCLEKKIEYLMSLPYPVVILPEEEGGYTGIVPDLPGCMTCAETWEELGEQLKDAKREWFKAVLEEGKEVPQPRWRHTFNERLSS
jgi:predicted RNase H-like HicB family nuclease